MASAAKKPPEDIPESGVVFSMRLTPDLAEILDQVVAHLESRNSGLRFTRSDAIRHIIASYRLAPAQKGGRS